MYEENKTNLNIKEIEENDQTILNIKSIKQEHIFVAGDEEEKIEGDKTKVFIII